MPICSPNANSLSNASLQPKRGAPQTPQGLFSGKHTMCGAVKSDGLFSNIFERHFAARTAIAAQTPICNPNANSLPNASLQPKRQFSAQTPVCSPNANSQPIASLQPKRQFAYLKHFCSQNAFQLPKRLYPIDAARKHRRACCQGGTRCAAL